MSGEFSDGFSKKQFDDLFRSRFERLRNWLTRGAQVDGAEAEDISQESFRILWEKRAEVRADGAVSYLHEIARLVANNRRKVERKWKKEDLDEASYLAQPDTASPERQLGAIQDLRLATRALQTVPPIQRKAFMLFREGMSHRDIATKLGIAERTSQHYARLVLNALMEARDSAVAEATPRKREANHRSAAELRSAVYDAYQSGMRHEEIAKQLGISAAASANYVAQAKNELRQKGMAIPERNRVLRPTAWTRAFCLHREGKKMAEIAEILDVDKAAAAEHVRYATRMVHAYTLQCDGIDPKDAAATLGMMAATYERYVGRVERHLLELGLSDLRTSSGSTGEPDLNERT